MENEEGDMKKIEEDNQLLNGLALEEDVPQKAAVMMPEQVPVKTVMVYWMDKENMRKEPIGILMERRKLERENNNAIGMLRLARKTFAKTEEEAQRILIGDFV
jgi:hypothetical protein